MSDNPLLDRLCSRDTLTEILACLDPLDTLIAYLRARGLDDARIAAELGLSRQSVWERMDAARRRVRDALPELASCLDGRRHSAHTRDANPPCDFTITGLARRLHVSRVTVFGWIRDGRLPGAYRRGSRWLIPPSALDTFHAPPSRRRPDLASRPPVVSKIKPAPLSEAGSEPDTTGP